MDELARSQVSRALNFLATWAAVQPLTPSSSSLETRLHTNIVISILMYYFVKCLFQSV